MPILLVILFIVFLVIGVPIAFVMGGSGIFTILFDNSINNLLIPQKAFNGISSFSLMAIPFFILAAELMTAGGLTPALLRFANTLVGHIRGGLGYVSVMVSLMFAGISGSALADAAGPGAIIRKMMYSSGYDKTYASAFSSANSIIGPVLPPSIMAIVYAMNEPRVTVLGIFMAGVIPGILMGTAMVIVNFIMSRKNDYLNSEKKSTVSDRLKAFSKAIPALLMPVIIVVGIRGGYFTPTEGAAVAAAYALFVGLIITRVLRLKDLPKIFLKSAILSSSVLLIVSMASIFTYLLTVYQIQQTLADFILSISSNRTVVLILLALIILAFGLFVDTLPALIILAPVLSPIAVHVGIDPTHFAMMMILNLAIGMITPPVGAVLFLVSGMEKIKMGALSRMIVPMLFAHLIVLLLIIFIPILSTGLPKLMGV